MIIKKLKLKNFMSYEYAQIDFDNGINVIVGKNGSGKSCIIDAIYIILLTLRNSGFKKEEIKNKWINKEPMVELHFDHNGTEYALKYENNQYFIKTGAIFKPYIQEKYKEFINENVFPEDIIKNAIIIRQDDIKLLSLDRKTRIEVIKKFVGIDDVSEALNLLEKVYKEWDKELKIKLETIQDLENVIDNTLDQKLKELKEKYKNVENKINELDYKEKELHKKLRIIEDNIKHLNSLINELNIKQEKVSLLEQDINKLNDKIKEISNAYIDEEEYKKIKKEYEKLEKKKKLKEKLEELKKDILDLNSQIKKMNYDKTIFEKYEKIEKEYQIQNELLNTIKRLKKEILEGYKEKLEKLKYLESLEIDKNLGLMQYKLEKLKSNLKELKEKKEIITNNEECPVCKNKLTKEIKDKLLKDIETDIKKIQEEISQINKKIKEYYDLLEEYKKLKKIEKSLISSQEKDEKIRELKNKINREIFEKYAIIKTKYLEEIRKQERYEILNKNLYERTKIFENLKKEYDSISIDENTKNINIFEIEKKYNNFKRLIEYKKEIKDKTEKLEKLKSTINLIKNKIKKYESIENLEKEKEFLDLKIKEIQTKKNILNTEFGEIKGQIKILNEKLEKQKEVIEKIKNLKEEIKDLESLIKKCSEHIKELDQYYTYLKNEAIPEIVEIASEIFVRLSDYEFERLEYIEDKDKFDVVAIKKGEKFDPKNLSGGQQTLYSLSLRFAIGIWSKKNVGLEKIDCMLLDEPTIHLDDSAIERLKNEIENLGLDQIIIVTHDPIFPKIANKIFRVNMDKGFSNIKEEKEIN